MKWLPEWLLTPELDGASVCVVDLCGECGHLCVYKADAQELPSGPDFSHELQKNGIACVSVCRVAWCLYGVFVSSN